MVGRTADFTAAIHQQFEPPNNRVEDRGETDPELVEDGLDPIEPRAARGPASTGARPLYPAPHETVATGCRHCTRAPCSTSQSGDGCGD